VGAKRAQAPEGGRRRSGCSVLSWQAIRRSKL